MSKTFGKKTILINSAYRSNPNSSSTTDFIYTFPETVRNVVHTNLLNAVVENGIYNVVAGVNDQFQMGFVNNNTPNITATFNSPATQTLPNTIPSPTMVFAGTTATGTMTVGAVVNICDGNGGVLAGGTILVASSTSLSIGLTSLLNGGSVITGFIINQFTPANASATSISTNNWFNSQIGQTKTFTIPPATGTFVVSTTTNVVVVNPTNNTIIGTASVNAVNATTLIVRISKVLISTTNLSTWAFYQSTGTPAQSTIIRTITIPAKYYDLESLVSNIQDLINSSIPTQWDLPAPLTDTKFVAKIDSQGFFYISNDDTPNWKLIFNQQGGQELLGFSPIVSSPPALPSASPLQFNNPYQIVSPAPMDIYNYDILLIQSDRLGNSITSAQGFDCWWVIPNANAQNNSTTITYENIRHPLLETAWKVPRDLEFIDIRLLDKSGKVVSIGNNNIQLVVECFTDDDARR